MGCRVALSHRVFGLRLARDAVRFGARFFEPSLTRHFQQLERKSAIPTHATAALRREAEPHAAESVLLLAREAIEIERVFETPRYTLALLVEITEARACGGFTVGEAARFIKLDCALEVSVNTAAFFVSRAELTATARIGFRACISEELRCLCVVAFDGASFDHQYAEAAAATRVAAFTRFAKVPRSAVIVLRDPESILEELAELRAGDKRPTVAPPGQVFRRRRGDPLGMALR